MKNFQHWEKKFAFLLIFFFAAIIIFPQNRFLLNPKERNAFKKANQYFISGRNFFKKQNYKRASQYFNMCIVQVPYYADAYYFLSRIEYLSGNYTDALKYIEKAKEDFGEFSQIITNTQLEQMKHAREVGGSLQFQNMIPDIIKIPAHYYFVHGNIFLKTEKFNEAYIQFLKTREINPGHGGSLNNLATIHFMAKEYEEAYKFIREAQKMNVKTNRKLWKEIREALKKSTDTGKK